MVTARVGALAAGCAYLIAFEFDKRQLNLMCCRIALVRRVGVNDATFLIFGGFAHGQEREIVRGIYFPILFPTGCCCACRRRRRRRRRRHLSVSSRSFLLRPGNLRSSPVQPCNEEELLRIRYSTTDHP